MNVWYELGSLVPSIGVGLLFWFAIRAMLRADRREREAERAAERDYARSHPRSPSTPDAPDTSVTARS